MSRTYRRYSVKRRVFEGSMNEHGGYKSRKQRLREIDFFRTQRKQEVLSMASVESRVQMWIEMKKAPTVDEEPVELVRANVMEKIDRAFLPKNLRSITEEPSLHINGILAVRLFQMYKDLYEQAQGVLDRMHHSNVQNKDCPELSSLDKKTGKFYCVFRNRVSFTCEDCPIYSLHLRIKELEGSKEEKVTSGDSDV